MLQPQTLQNEGNIDRIERRKTISQLQLETLTLLSQ